RLHTTTPPPPPRTLFPYTTLFRSLAGEPDREGARPREHRGGGCEIGDAVHRAPFRAGGPTGNRPARHYRARTARPWPRLAGIQRDRKSTRLNSSHVKISYAVFCLT